MIAASEQRIRARLAELPDGEFHATDFLEHDGHSNALYKLDLHLTKRGERLTFDFSQSSKQAPGFINSTRSGLMGSVTGAIMVSIIAGTHSHGQGHATVFAQCVHDWLGVPFEKIRYVQGDTAQVGFGRGTYGARSAVVGGSALKRAADGIIEKAKPLAAAMGFAQLIVVVIVLGLRRSLYRGPVGGGKG